MVRAHLRSSGKDFNATKKSDGEHDVMSDNFPRAKLLRIFTKIRIITIPMYKHYLIGLSGEMKPQASLQPLLPDPPCQSAA